MNSQVTTLLHPEQDTTETLSLHPHIVRSDKRWDGAPYFLYLPHERGDMVFVDYSININNIASWPLWQIRSEDFPRDSKAFSVERVQGKGLGLVANRMIAAGELIYSERPIYAAPRILSCPPDQTDANGIFFRAAMKELSTESRRKFFELHNAYPSDVDCVPGILNTNCLPLCIDASNPISHVGCFPTLSRINHDCCPNAKYSFNLTTFRGEVRAMRLIRAGQEITITYTHLDQPRRERQRALSQARFFTCACKTCSLPLDRRNESDARRERIQTFKQLEDVDFPPRIPLDQLNQVLASAGEEALVEDYAIVLLIGSQNLTIYDDLDIAIGWVRKAREYFSKFECEGSYYLRKLDDADRVHRRMQGGT
ncbi:hypothetical protein NLI96_g4196 [Meripilus lineatus]|uniref:SET domain-containing protein n=1 Tax=Meripilus lineatus TaxID=2056292 RepID=A0AAD5V5A6_9APHY|nr:hypothetical protein NLI96_g4196 [Physisporinus lineatus]